MTPKTLLAVMVLTGIATFTWERGASVKLRQQNESLLAAKQEVDRLVAENRDLSKLRTATTAFEPMSRSETSELLRLRNEVGPLRAKKLEAEQLRTDNQRLESEIKAVPFKQSRLPDAKALVPKSSWVDAGFETPENAVQTFFWALRQHDNARILGCLTPLKMKELESLASYSEMVYGNLDQLKDSRQTQEIVGDYVGRFADNLVDKLEEGYRISDKQTLPNNKITLRIQRSDGEEFPLYLNHLGTEWKLDSK